MDLNSSPIYNNVSTENRAFNIPSLEEISDRFENIEVNLYVTIDHNGYIREIKGNTPFKGIVSVKNIINILNRDINVIINSDSDLTKLRNSIIYYNEYFTPNEKLNIHGYKPAPIAFSRIESQYIKRIGETVVNSDKLNPFKNNLIQEIDNIGFVSDIDSALDEYIRKKKKNEISIQSAKFKGHEKKEKVVPLHSIFCTNMPRVVDFDDLEFCFEDCEYY